MYEPRLETRASFVFCCCILMKGDTKRAQDVAGGAGSAGDGKGDGQTQPGYGHSAVSRPAIARRSAPSEFSARRVGLLPSGMPRPLDVTCDVTCDVTFADV